MNHQVPGSYFHHQYNLAPQYFQHSSQTQGFTSTQFENMNQNFHLFNNFTSPNNVSVFQLQNRQRQLQINHYQFNHQFNHPLNQFKPQQTHTLEQKYGVLNPPPINHPVPQTHYTYLTELIESVRFNKTNQAPQILINYLLQLISLQDCPYPLSALTFISVCIPEFPNNFAPYQLEHLIKTLNSKYPISLNYKNEYKKLQIMDRKQSQKLLDLMQTLCILSCTIQQYYISNQYASNKMDIPEYYYINRVVNYVMVLLEYCQLAIKQQGQYDANWAIQTFNSNATQLKNLLCDESNQFMHNMGNRNKILDIIYEMLPKNEIISIIPQSPCVLLNFIQLYLKTCHRININGTNQLYTYFSNRLKMNIQRIGVQTHRIRQSLKDNQYIQSLFYQHACQVVNILNIKIWTKDQKLSFIRLLYGCRFVCGLTETNQEDPSNKFMEQAVSIAKEKNLAIKDTQKKDENINKQRRLVIKKTEGAGQIDCDEFW